MGLRIQSFVIRGLMCRSPLGDNVLCIRAGHPVGISVGQRKENIAMSHSSVGSFFLAGLIFGTLTSITTAVEESATEDITVKGKFEWSKRPGFHDLKGTLTPTGDNEWSVVWDFSWKGKVQVCRGIVKGDITNGAVSGTGNGHFTVE